MFSSFGASNPSSTFPTNNNANINTLFNQNNPTFGVGSPFFGSAQRSPPSFTPTLNSNAFGQSPTNTTSFNTTLFGNSSPQLPSNPFTNTSIFGKPATLKPLNQIGPASNNTIGFGLFKNIANFSSNTINEQLGTPLKFKITKDNESIFKSGVNHSMNINFQSITCMKEYENKSFEELRYEDYQLNQKGFKSEFLGTQNNNASFYNNSTTITTAGNSLFGNQENKLIFNQASTSNAFGQTNPLFGINTVKTTPTEIFGSSMNDVNMTPNTSSSSIYNTNMQSNGLFNSISTPTPQFSFSIPPGASFGQPLGFGTSSLFTSSQPSTSQSIPPFSQTNGLFNQNKTFNITSPKTNNTFGQSPLPQSNTVNTTNQNQPLFNSCKMFNLPTNNSVMSLFDKQKSNAVAGSGFPITCGTSLFGNSPNKPSTTFNMNPLGNFAVTACTPTQAYTCQVTDSFQNPSQHQQIISMASSPYGSSDLLNNITPVDIEVKQFERITNPHELSILLKSVQSTKTPTKREKIKPVSAYEQKETIFCGLEFPDESLISNMRINENPKRLLLRNSRKLYSDSIFDSEISCTCDNGYENNENIIDSHDDALDCYEWLPDSHTNNISSYPLESSETCLCDEIKTNVETKSIQTDTIYLPELSKEQTDSADCSCSDVSETKSTPVNHPTGIILSRPEYYTVPSLDELINYINEDGTCYVKGFTIGRYGYGNVYFPDTFNVSNLNIDELVHFRHKEIIIYPDDDKKPPRGHELNRRAQVTLDKVWPRDKKTKKLITDVHTLTEIDYVGKLKSSCEKQKTQFVDYRPDTGSWVFRVREF